MLKKNIILAVFLGLFVFSIASVYGQGIVPNASGSADSRTCPSGDATYCGNYLPSDFVVLAINVSKWIMGMVGSLSLLMFIYGGAMFLISGGGSEKISQAKKIIIAAVIGLVIVFTSYLIIQFVLGSMGLTWSGTVTAPNAK